MKKVTKFFMAALLAGVCSCGYGQTICEWKKPSKSNEIVIGTVENQYPAGYASRYKYPYNDVPDEDERYSVSDEQLYEKLLKLAKEKYGNEYPKLALRNFKASMDEELKTGEMFNMIFRLYNCSAEVVIKKPLFELLENLSSTLNKTLRDVPEGSRLAIDRILSSKGEIDRDELKDQLIDMLLDKGYKVVAKEYLAKLYEEQKDQQSGIYNDNTTVQTDNFSAVG